MAALAGRVPLGLAAWIANEVLGVLDVQYLYASGVMLLLGLGLMGAVSRASAPPESVRIAHTFAPAQWRIDLAEDRRRPWYARFETLSLLLTALTAALLGWWW